MPIRVELGAIQQFFSGIAECFISVHIRTCLLFMNNTMLKGDFLMSMSAFTSLSVYSEATHQILSITPLVQIFCKIVNPFAKP